MRTVRAQSGGPFLTKKPIITTVKHGRAPSVLNLLADSRTKSKFLFFLEKSVLKIKVFMKMVKIAFPFFSCRWTFHAWNRKIGNFSAIAPTPRFNDGENCHIPEQLFLPHHIIARGGRGIFPIFPCQAGRKNWQIYIFHIVVFLWKKRFWKKLSFFVIFLISIFRLFLGVKKLLWKKRFSSLIKKWLFFMTSYLRLFSDHGLNATFPRSVEYICWE